MDSEPFLQVMRHWATGVTIVTAAHAGVQHGMTVSSFTSVSLEPPLALVALERTTRTHALVAASGAFGVCILRAGQEELSNHFAGHDTEQADRFAGLQINPGVTGAPLLADCLAALECRVVAAHPAGTHTVFVGQVVAARPGAENEPLIYTNRGYHRLAASG